jgi:phage-related minor tail protein
MALDIGLLNVLVSLGLASDAGEKLADDIGKAVGPAAEKVGQSLSDKISGGMTKAGKGLSVGLTAPILAVGGAALTAGMEVDGALDTIRVKTGATGAELEQLGKDFEAVASTGTASFERTGEIIADLNTRLGLTGEPLQTLAGQLVDLEQITGNAANLDAVTRVLGAFNIPADQASETLDKLFRASQSSGVEFNKLTEQLVSQSAAFAELGFGLDETAALLAQFEASGVNTSTVLAGLRVSIVKAAKEGKDASTFFRDGVKEIEGFVKAGDNAAAQAAAKELFGARTFLDALDAIRRGQFDIEGTFDAITNGQDSIAGLADATEDFPEKFAKLKKQAGLALLPIAEQLIPAIASALEAVTPIITKLSEAFGNLSPETQKVIVVVGGVLATLGPLLIIGAKVVSAISTITKAFGALKLALVGNPWILVAVAAVAAVVLIIKNWDTIAAFFSDLWEGIKDGAKVVWDAIVAAVGFAKDVIVGYFQAVLTFWKTVLDGILTAAKTVWELIRAAVSFVIDLIVGYFRLHLAIWETIINGILTAARVVWDGVRAAAQLVIDLVVGYFQRLFDIASGIFTAIRDAATGAWNLISVGAQTLYSKVSGFFGQIRDTVTDVANRIKEIFNSAWETLKGGVQGVYDFFVGIFTKIRDLINGVVERIKNLPGDILGGFGSIAKAVIPGLASGGTAVGGQPYLVGELGPELVIPRRTSTVIPNNQLGNLGAGNGLSYDITIVNPAPEAPSVSIPAALRRASYLRGD